MGMATTAAISAYSRSFCLPARASGALCGRLWVGTAYQQPTGVAWQAVGVMLAAYEIALEYAQLDYSIGRFVADAEALYSYEGTRAINTLIVGRAITGLSAFV